ncbi:hypothetical protein ACHAWF_012334 [Thalassiosira exigua]
MHVTVTVTKLRADSKLGFSYITHPEGVSVASVDEDGLFGGTDLKAGQEIICVNGIFLQKEMLIQVESGVRRQKAFDRAEMRALLASLPSGNVTLIVKPKPPSKDCRVIFKHAMKDDIIRGSMEIEGNEMPKVLKKARVPWEQWWLVYTLISKELMPISLKCIAMNERYNCWMKAYVKDQISNKSSYHTKVRLEKSVHMMGVQTGILHNNVTLVATAVKDRINSILAKYHVVSSLYNKSISLPALPGDDSDTNHMAIAVGFVFHSDYLTVYATPIAPSVAIETAAPAVAVPAVSPEPDSNAGES